MTETPLHPFAYDPFQQRAIAVIEQGRSLFVSAPTGSGKTVLADYVIGQTLSRHQRVIYTAPIKALSNQKFRDFTVRYGERVGILTGDVTINATAPLVIMTTEIYRNTLLEDVSRLARYAWIIFDEIHYLDDRERGTVWEEALVLTPEHINLLCLSATIPNVAELASWLRTIHQRPVEVIEETHRPVPLTFAFQCQNVIVDTPQDLKRTGYRGHDETRHAFHHHRYGHRPPLRANRIEPLIRHLQDHDRLPAILFTFGRRRAEDLAWELSALSLLSPVEQRAMRETFQALCARFQVTQDRTIDALGRLIDRGVAYHHAGMLPTAKEILERCFASRQLKLIVTTETFALGVNMPARSVILDALHKRAGAGFELLRQREFLQMAGRAGRRGMDAEGFVYLRINPRHITYPEILRLLQAHPEPVQSRLNATYATLLNLFRHHGRALLELFPKTLYYFQTTGPRRQAGRELMERKLALLEAMGYLTTDQLTDKGHFAAWLYGYELILTELYSDRHLSGLDPTALALLLAAVVFEPKPRALPPKSHRFSKRLADLCSPALARIHKEEVRFRIAPKTKAPAFHLSHALDAWMAKTPFDRLTKLCEVDEGEIVRYFRMTVQLLRQLGDVPTVDAALRATAQQALRRINRDLIDAEAQLRLG